MRKGHENGDPGLNQTSVWPIYMYAGQDRGVGQRRKFPLKNLKVQSSEVEFVFTRGSGMHLYAVAAL